MPDVVAVDIDGCIGLPSAVDEKGAATRGPTGLNGLSVYRAAT